MAQIRKQFAQKEITVSKNLVTENLKSVLMTPDEESDFQGSTQGLNNIPRTSVQLRHS